MTRRAYQAPLAFFAAIGLAGIGLWSKDVGACLAYFGTMCFVGAVAEIIADRLETLISQSATQ